jgi:UDP-N-acetylglucosamine--N-acetylmuramyl-(pentapeptide) pyrophosphoryl-undecaprenol N-acetylglucosamine transferase
MNELLKRFQIVHICGRGNLDMSLHKKGYVQYEFLNEQMKDVYSISELVISRGGANSLAEIAALKKKALVIPLGTAASRGDQIENAQIFSRKLGWGVMVGDVQVEDFIKAVEMVNRNKLNVSEKFRNGVYDIVKLILKAGK